MKRINSTLLAGLFALMFAATAIAQPPTTARTFRMFNDATHYIQMTADPTALGTGTFTWIQPALGIIKSNASGLISIGAVDLNSTDVTNILPVIRGGTGTNTFGPAGSIAYSQGASGPLGFSAVGTTGQILVSGGSGAPTWSSTLPPGTGVPFSQITSGTNTQPATMTVGNGSILNFSGTGIVAANQFMGTGSTSNAVDLNTGEVNGTLGVVNGGTGSTTVGGNGQVAYSNGTNYNFSTGGTTGQFLTFNSGGAPTWTSTLPPTTTIPFDKITSGTNLTATMTVGTGATLSHSGTGTVDANSFTGTGSTSTAVDLATAEVGGVLPIANGGTNNSAAGSNGQVVYSDGTKHNYTAVGTNGQFLMSTGAGAPTWANVIAAKATGRQQGDGTNFSYTVTPGGGYTATSPVVLTVESANNQTVALTARTATTFTFQTANILSVSEFVSWVVY